MTSYFIQNVTILLIEYFNTCREDLVVHGGRRQTEISNTFKREKTKKKRGQYTGGSIDTSVNSIKFDSDSE
jgi:hypothetical protein